MLYKSCLTQNNLQNINLMVHNANMNLMIIAETI